MKQLGLLFGTLVAFAFAWLVVTGKIQDARVRELEDFCRQIVVGERIELSVERAQKLKIETSRHTTVEGYLFESQPSVTIIPEMAFCDVRSEGGSVISREFFRD